MKRKSKHIVFLCLAVLLIGSCAASPFVISALQNNSLLDAVKTEAASALDVEKKDLTLLEKLELFLCYQSYSDAADSGITMSEQWGKNTSLRSKTAVEDAVREQLQRLSAALDTPEIAKSSEDMSVSACTPRTYVDQNDPACCAVFWVIEMQSENQSESMDILMEDESRKICAFYFGVKRPVEASNTLSRKQANAMTIALSDYLGIPLEPDNTEQDGGSVTSYYTILGKTESTAIRFFLAGNLEGDQGLFLSFSTFSLEKSDRFSKEEIEMDRN